MSSYFAAAAAAVWGGASSEAAPTAAHINPKHATKEEVDSRIDALAAALASTDTATLLRKGGEPGLLPSAAGTIDRATLSRWLKAEKLDVASAASRLEKHAHWRADYVSCLWSWRGAGQGKRKREREKCWVGILASKRSAPSRFFLTLNSHLSPSFSRSISNLGADGTYRAGEGVYGDGECMGLEGGKGGGRQIGLFKLELDVGCFFSDGRLSFASAAALDLLLFSFRILLPLLFPSTAPPPNNSPNSPRSPRSSPTTRSSSNPGRTPRGGPSSSSPCESTTRTATRPRSRG